MSDAFDDAYGGVLTRLSRIVRRAHDPDVHQWGGVVPPWGPRTQDLITGGAGWDDESARDACIGEALERLQAYAMPGDGIVEARHGELPNPSIGPGRWTLFHPDQHRDPEFPFVPFDASTRCRWVCFREVRSGEPRWIPEEAGFLFHAPGGPARIAPSYSTGLSCGRSGHPVLLRGLQEVVERDAVLGAWWGTYPLEEWDPGAALDPALAARVRRPHRRYRCYRVRSPFSGHATIVTVEGEDRDGFLFAAGSACRETLSASWAKSLLEAVQGAAYVRQLQAERPDPKWTNELSDFAHHAAYYTAHPALLGKTVLNHAGPPTAVPDTIETAAVLQERLGPERPVLFRLMTPPGIAEQERDWIVLRVVVPGLQPLHGNDRWPHLGGPLWNRPASEWSRVPPHPFA